MFNLTDYKAFSLQTYIYMDLSAESIMIENGLYIAIFADISVNIFLVQFYSLWQMVLKCSIMLDIAAANKTSSKNGKFMPSFILHVAKTSAEFEYLKFPNFWGR